MYCAVIQNAAMQNPASLKRWMRVIGLLGYAGGIAIVLMTPAVFSLVAGRFSRIYFHDQFILYAVLWAFILMAAVNGRGWIRRFFALPALRFVGALSFSLYLFHPIFLDVARNSGLNGYLSAWLVLLASTAAAYVSFRLLEGPVSRFRITRETLAPLLAGRRRPDASAKIEPATQDSTAAGSGRDSGEVRAVGTRIL
jgi:peptidoglycan/LPS O-acetylase OafA/YrhL